MTDEEVNEMSSQLTIWVCQEKCVSYLKFHKNQIVKEQ